MCANYRVLCTHLPGPLYASAGSFVRTTGTSVRYNRVLHTFLPHIQNVLSWSELNFVCSLVCPALGDVRVRVVVVLVVAGQLGRHSVPGVGGLALTTAVTSRAVCSFKWVFLINCWILRAAWFWRRCDIVRLSPEVGVPSFSFLPWVVCLQFL